jgi:signal transduction histidine kinase
MSTAPKRKKKNPESLQIQEVFPPQDVQENQNAGPKTGLAGDRSFSFDPYVDLLENDLDQIKDHKTSRPNEEAPFIPEENRFKREFLFKTFHDMRNPLHVIMGYTSLVLRKTRDQIPLNHQENLEKVIESADRLQELVDKMIAYYRKK